MSKKDNIPVRVTGEERRHPSIRQLARACIALARLRLEQQAQAEHVSEVREAPPVELVESQADSTGEEVVGHG